MRRPVWKALSDLFVDPEERDDSQDDSIVRALAESPYDLQELDAILSDEVYRICQRHFWDRAERVGFGAEWLEAQILLRAGDARSVFPTFRRLEIGVNERWLDIKRRVNEFRLLGED